MGKATDPRAAGFVEKHAQLTKIELDALEQEQRDLDMLKKLFG